MVALEKTEKLGICMTCKHKTDCTYIKMSSNYIIHCEEFEVYKYQKVKDENPVDDVHLIMDDSGKYTGLCINCDNRHFCVNAKKEHIVWQCQEYV